MGRAGFDRIGRENADLVSHRAPATRARLAIGGVTTGTPGLASVDCSFDLGIADHHRSRGTGVADGIEIFVRQDEAPRLR